MFSALKNRLQCYDRNIFSRLTDGNIFLLGYAYDVSMLYNELMDKPTIMVCFKQCIHHMIDVHICIGDI